MKMKMKMKFIKPTNGNAWYIEFPEYTNERTPRPLVKSSNALDMDSDTCGPIFLGDNFHLKNNDINALIEILQHFRDNDTLVGADHIIERWYPEN